MTAPSSDDEPTVDSEPEDPASLYDPPADEGEDYVAEGDEDFEQLRIEIPRALARRLLRVSTHLGLSPSLVASRAIDLVWDEIGSVSHDNHLSTQTLIERYQARVDLLQILESGHEEDGDEHATRSESSESPASSVDGDGDGEQSETDVPKLWEAWDDVQDGESGEELNEQTSGTSRSVRRRPEKEEHSWDEVDDIIETGEDSR